ncbi:MAG: class I SAM-dependent methyltransferase [Bryobacterales bacterium]|nr:class I SAM-dependent methyltransferase [Bryobacteraceae bacterium]MDW8130520.1 class I SAM-dependent methyltransferase [Bryobacterales bacterium]
MKPTFLALAAGLGALACLPAQQAPLRPPDVPYGASPPEVVRAMLELAGVTSRDVVYDLGCGDGRIVIAAAKEFGARGVGIDIDPERIAESRENARKAGVEDRVSFRNEDLFESDIREATVVTLYLGAWMNEKVRPKLLRELRPGTRVVSHGYDMGDWTPEKEVELDGHKIYLWRIPPRPQQPKH